MPPGRFAARASHGIERERSFSRESGSNRRQMRFPVHYSESARYQPIGRHHRPWRDPTAHRRRICLRNIATRRRQDLAFRWAAMSCSSSLPSTYAKVDGSIVAAWRPIANMRALALRVLVGELMFGNKLRWTNPRPNVLWQHCLCGSSAARWAAIVSSRFYSAGTANGSSGDGLTLSCRGFPIKTG